MQVTEKLRETIMEKMGDVYKATDRKLQQKPWQFQNVLVCQGRKPDYAYIWQKEKILPVLQYSTHPEELQH